MHVHVRVDVFHNPYFIHAAQSIHRNDRFQSSRGTEFAMIIRPIMVSNFWEFSTSPWWNELIKCYWGVEKRSVIMCSCSLQCLCLVTRVWNGWKFSPSTARYSWHNMPNALKQCWTHVSKLQDTQMMAEDGKSDGTFGLACAIWKTSQHRAWHFRHFAQSREYRLFLLLKMDVTYCGSKFCAAPLKKMPLK